MIYFASYMILDLNIDTLFLYPMLIKENTDTPIIFQSEYNNISKRNKRKMLKG